MYYTFWITKQQIILNVGCYNIFKYKEITVRENNKLYIQIKNRIIVL